MMLTEKDIVIKRLIYRSWHRGCKETDIILGNFADNELSAMGDSEIALFEQLLDEHDADIWKWLINKEQPDNAEYISLIEKLRIYGKAPA